MPIAEQQARRLDAQPLDGPRRRRAHGGGVVAQEAALAHAGRVGRAGDREVAARDGRAIQACSALKALALLQRQRGAELRLAARPLEEDHQLARHRQGEVAAEILLDQRQRQVDPGGDAGRGPDVAVAR